MSEAKDNYYGWLKLHVFCGQPLSKNITDYVSELEKQNEEMKEFVKELYNAKYFNDYKLLNKKFKKLLSEIINIGN